VFVSLQLVGVINKMYIGEENKNHIASKLHLTMVQTIKEKEFYFNQKTPENLFIIYV